jgi:hypothetical protein
MDPVSPPDRVFQMPERLGGNKPTGALAVGGDVTSRCAFGDHMVS